MVHVLVVNQGIKKNKNRNNNNNNDNNKVIKSKTDKTRTYLLTPLQFSKLKVSKNIQKIMIATGNECQFFTQPEKVRPTLQIRLLNEIIKIKNNDKKGEIWNNIENEFLKNIGGTDLGLISSE